MKTCTFALLLVVLTLTPAAYADDYRKPDEFFNKNYVNAPNRAKKTPTPRAARVPTSVPALLPSMPPVEATAVSPSPTPRDERTGVKLEALSLIVNADDPSHLATHLMALRRISAKTGAPIKEIFIIGDTTKLFRSAERRLLSGDGNSGTVRYLRRMPANLRAIKRSPAFLLKVKEGTIVMEGFDDIEKGFNSAGEFVEPENKE